MATYVNDLRLKEIATGDESGTWGTSTNTNLELIGEALGYGTEGITTNANTHTTTVADGATDPGRAMYIEYTGTLDSACTITIAPNTLNRVHIIENGTSGSQSIIIKQGSGATVTIPTGATKMVYLDGAGSGAKVTDALASLNLETSKVIETTASIQTPLIEFTDGDDAITIADGGGTTFAQTATFSGDIDLAGSIDVDGTSNLDVVDIDGAVDMASTLQVDGAITSSSEMTLTRADNGINLSLISTDADANEGPGLVLYRNSSSPADSDVLGQIYLQGENDADQKVTYALIEGRIEDASDGTEDGRLEINTVLAGTAVSRILMNTTETVLNDNSKDLDFRIESNGQANLFVVNGGTDNIGIGIAGPTFASGHGIHLADGFNIGFGTGNGTRPDFQITGDNGGLQFACGTGSDTADVLFDTSGNVGIGTSSPAVNLEISSSQPNINLTDSDNARIAQLSGSAGDLYLRADTGNGAGSSKIILEIDGSEKARMDADGRMGFGVTSTGSGRITVQETSTGSSGILVMNNASTVNSSITPLMQMQFNGDSSLGTGSRFIAFANSNDFIGSITGAPSNVAYNTSSDRNLKENIVDASSQLDIVKAIQIREFDWKKDSHHDLGVIAQELYEVIPNIVTEGSETPDADGFVMPWSVDYGKLTPYLTQAIQEQQKLIESLTARITTLEG